MLGSGSQPQPSRDWLSPRLGYLAGSRSRAKVRNWFRQQDRDQHLRHGREMLERELARLNIRDVATDDIAVQLKQKDTDTLCVLLGSGELTAGSIATALQQLREPDLPRPRRKKRLRKKPSKPGGIAVSGVGELMTTFSRCCKPVPPEPISGYITQGRGVSIHRNDCGNFLGLKGRNPERVIEVDWGGAESSQYPVDLTLQAYDRNGLIRDVTAVLADEDVNIMDLQSTTDKKLNEVEMRLSIEIRDLPTLSTAISRLEQLPNVFSVRRRA